MSGARRDTSTQGASKHGHTVIPAKAGTQRLGFTARKWNEATGFPHSRECRPKSYASQSPESAPAPAPVPSPNPPMPALIQTVTSARRNVATATLRSTAPGMQPPDGAQPGGGYETEQ